MKKVMTALATAATALLAFGDVQSGTSFEDLTTGEKAINALVGHTDAGGDSGYFYWLSDAVDKTETALSISNYVSEGISTPIASRPDQFASDSNTKYLHIDVSSPLYRTINPANDKTVSTLTGQAIGDGIYLDTLVQFTAADQVFDTDSLGEGDKIAIEYAATDDTNNPITNFVIRAGYFGSEFTTTNYYAAVPQGFDVDAWHRLTVRALASIDATGHTGFVVYLDNQPLVYDTTKTTACGDDFTATGAAVNFYKSGCYALYPSAVQTGVYKTTLAAVAFQGNGAIDDISFTSTTPQFIADSEAVVATFTADAGVTAITVTVDQTDYNVDMTALTVSLPAGTTTFTVTATIDNANGYSLASLNGGNSNPATVSDYAGDTIAISTTRNNFTLFDENGDLISGTYQTLADAMKATGVAKIQLAYDYDAITFEGKDFAGYTIAGDVVLDLAGNDFNGGDDSAGTSLFTVSGTLTIIDSVGGGKITYDTKYGYAIVELTGTDAFIGATTGDEGATFDGQLFKTGFEGGLIRAKVKTDGNTTNDKLTWTVAPGSECAATAVDGYWVVAPKVTWADVLGAAVDGAYEIDDLAELKKFQANVGKIATSNVTFKLIADITLDTAWPGIGIQNGKDLVTSATQSDVDDFNAGAFHGTFDGQNHTISGFQMIGKGDNAEGLDYAGFFNSTLGATIQNLKIQYAGSTFAADTTSSTKESGATFVGVAKNSTLRNLTTVAGTVSCSKGFGGIVGYLYGTTVDSCTNNVNLTSLANNKCGGIAMICQQSGCAISNCVNNGTMTTGSGEHGGILGYTDTITIYNCQNTAACKMFYHHGGTVTLDGVIKGNATVASYTGNATPGLNFATVDGSVATFVADGALAAGNTYKAMHAATATFVFAEAGTIAFDTNLVQAVTFAITAAQESGLEVTENATADGVVTFTAASSATPVQPGGTDGETYNDAQAATNAAEKVVVSVPEAVTTAGVDAATYKAMFEAKVVNNDGTYSVVVDLKPAIEAEVQTAVDNATVDTLEDVLAADGASASVTVTTKPGLYYQIVTGNALPLGEPVAKNWTMATGDSTSITVTKPDGNAAFFKVHCTPAK